MELAYDFDDFEDLFPSGWTLRDYQSLAIEKVGEAFREHEKLLLVMATGTGKTVVFSRIASEASKRKPVLVLAHLGELLEQAKAKLEKEGLRVGIEKAEDEASPYDEAVVASWQTLYRDTRLEGWAPDHFGLIIVDESHRSLSKGYQKILQYFNRAKVLGVTATADRGDQRGLDEFYETIAFEYGLRQACLDGWLVRPVAQTIPLKIDLTGVKTKSGDLDQAEVGHRIEPFLGQIAGEIRRIAPERKHMIFMPSVETAQKMAAALEATGFRAGWVSGESPDRFAILDRYERGDLNALVNCMLLTEGYDHDGIDCVTVLRPTKIRSLLAQAVGRGTRPLSTIVPQLQEAGSAKERQAVLASSAKPNLLILDFLWLTARLDLAKPASLIARNSEVAKRMAEKNGDLLALEEESERDYIESLKREMARHSRKKSRMIDPINFALALDDPDLATFEPATAWEAQTVTDGQKRMLSQFGIEASRVTCRGQAAKLINGLLRRSKSGLAVPRQIEFFRRLGIDARGMTAKEAAKRQKQQIEEWRARKGKKAGQLEWI